MTAPHGPRTVASMNPFKNYYRILFLLLLPIVAGVATLALAVTGEQGWSLKGATEVHQGIMTVETVSGHATAVTTEALKRVRS